MAQGLQVGIDKMFNSKPKPPNPAYRSDWERLFLELTDGIIYTIDVIYQMDNLPTQPRIHNLSKRDWEKQSVLFDQEVKKGFQKVGEAINRVETTLQSLVPIWPEGKPLTNQVQKWTDISKRLLQVLYDLWEISGKPISQENTRRREYLIQENRKLGPQADIELKKAMKIIGALKEDSAWDNW